MNFPLSVSPATFSFIPVSVMTPNIQGCTFLAVGASRAHSRTSWMIHSSILVSLNFRTLWRHLIMVVPTFMKSHWVCHVKRLVTRPRSPQVSPAAECKEAASKGQDHEDSR